MEAQSFNRQKFDNLVHYIIGTCPDPAKLGSVKLHKILWRSDTKAYLTLGRSITGAKYVRQKHGPTANALLGARERLLKLGKIRFWRDEGFAYGRPKDVYVSQLPPEMNLSIKEKQIVDFWVRHICLNHTAETISDETHDYAWEIAEIGEELPMFTAFIERLREEPTKEVEEWATEEVRRLGPDAYEKL